MSKLSVDNVAIHNLFGFEGFDIYWYGVLIAIGFVLAYLICSLLCKKRNYPEGLPTDMVILSVIGSIVGARLYYVAFKWSEYYVKGDFVQTLENICDTRNGGLAIYGGVFGAIFCLFIYSRIKNYKLIQLMDIAAAPLALGQAIGRWGNFFNQEAHGALVTDEKLQFFPYSVFLDSPKGGDPAGWYQATFFYESAWCLLIFGVLLLLFFKQKYHGQLSLVYFVMYGAERGYVEWLRTDQLQIFGKPVSALLSIALGSVSLVLLIVFAITKRKNDTLTVIKNNEPLDARDEAVIEEIEAKKARRERKKARIKTVKQENKKKSIKK